ncbi:pyrroline-5-carboxylate reductase dimerization domain-containing protein [Streptomyces sp. NPDC006638]|uniref:pyrroline-5-carboxylate reductase family protein n=1 Tax=Streptomyces sp. NPDC006638 TaxID=3157183 RepID=UPI0033A5070D
MSRTGSIVTDDRTPLTGDRVPLVAVLGAGHIGGTVVARLLAGGHPPSRLRATTRSRAHAAEIAAAYGIATGEDNAEAASGADILVLAVRPDQADAVLAEALRVAEPARYVVSFVAGYSLARLTSAAGPTPVHAFRVATNVAALEKSGVLAVSTAPSSPAESLERVTAALRPLGTFVPLPESQQDTAASTLGSGAAFLALAAAGVREAASAAGVAPEHALLFTVEALECAAALLRQAGPAAAEPWVSLVTPGGLTAAGIDSLLSRGVSDHMAEAVRAAVDRARVVTPTPAEAT